MTYRIATSNTSSQIIGTGNSIPAFPYNYTYTVSTAQELYNVFNDLKNNSYNGMVSIKCNPGTYNLTQRLLLDVSTIGSCSMLQIYADEPGTVIFNCSNCPNNRGFFTVTYGGYLWLSRITIINTDTKNAQVGVQSDYGKVLVQNCTFKNWVEGVTAVRLGMIKIDSALTCDNCTSSILCGGGLVTFTYNASLNFSNSTYGIQLLIGGIVNSHGCKRNFTSVTNVSNVSIGTANANGYFGGYWHT